MYLKLATRSWHTTVWVTTDDRVVDAHRHFMQGAGHSEHGVKTLLTPGASAAIPGGPNMSRKNFGDRCSHRRDLPS